mmetsp:Transcript_5379/g.12337  ORF Transcript_5379/g.12337 Transcript_5379/m.12337 type:complete len:207 (+) Transcript_5379:773-1393(+)
MVVIVAGKRPDVLARGSDGHDASEQLVVLVVVLEVLLIQSHALRRPRPTTSTSCRLHLGEIINRDILRRDELEEVIVFSPCDASELEAGVVRQPHLQVERSRSHRIAALKLHASDVVERDQDGRLLHVEESPLEREQVPLVRAVAASYAASLVACTFERPRPRELASRHAAQCLAEYLHDVPRKAALNLVSLRRKSLKHVVRHRHL